MAGEEGFCFNSKLIKFRFTTGLEEERTLLLVYQTDGPNLEHEIENSPFDSWGVTNSSAKRGKIYVSFLNRESLSEKQIATEECY